MPLDLKYLAGETAFVITVNAFVIAVSEAEVGSDAELLIGYKAPAMALTNVDFSWGGLNL
jgi:hypothetical protein